MTTPTPDLLATITAACTTPPRIAARAAALAAQEPSPGPLLPGAPHGPSRIAQLVGRPRGAKRRARG